MLGTIDDSIANQLGLTAPAVITFTWNWCVPPALAVVSIWAYHLFKSQGPNWRRQLLGLVMAAAGAMLLLGGIGLLVNRGADRAASAPAQPDLKAASNLEQRFKQLETELNATRQELQETKSQLATEQKIATATKTPQGFTQLTIRQLRALYEGRTRLQADAFMADEKGKLIDVDGVVVNIDNGMAYLRVGNRADDAVECRFDPEWNPKLNTYSVGDRMKIRGTIGPTQNGAQIYLKKCTILP